ncbi:uncharacterized protein LOC130744360 [Lotus japonicus]|uniref:uncharacterized protein LOC130744360 n=1 Tax=Lotus japonicus TaxID=34305 RepID=UPI002585489B|nr:uncharacterized protein LOC130744360 [Lotus japonicus]
MSHSESVTETHTESALFCYYYPDAMLNCVSVALIKMSLPKSYEVDMPQERVEERQLSNVEDRHDVPIAADYTEQFTTDRVFVTRDELLDWAKNVGKQLGFVIIIRRSDYGSKGRRSKDKQLTILVCEMSGKYKPYKHVLMRKGTGTKKCDCPFRLMARYTSEDGLWRLTVVRGDHNHAPAETLVGHAYVGRLTSQEKDMVGKMVDNKVKSGNMLLALKEVNPQNLTTIRQVYNERMTHIRAKRGQLSEMQHLMWLLEEDKEEDMPKVRVTDKDTALMNAVTTTFPTSAQLLCQFHIAKCVKAKCKLTIEDKEMWDDVGDAWNRVMYAESAEEFNASMDFLRSLVGEHSNPMHYIKETWLSFKHKFVKYAIDRYMHMGNTTTNRVEGAHAKLKACIKDIKSDMCAAWAAIHRCTLLQHTRINAAFQASIFIREHTFKEKLYDNLRGVVSRYALMLIANEKARVGKCSCTMRRTHDLPCSC